MRRSTGSPFVRPLGPVVGVAAVLAVSPAVAADPPAEPATNASTTEPGVAPTPGPMPPPAAAEPPTDGRPRSWFEAHGISFGLASKADVLSKVRGGTARPAATRYRGYLDLVTTIDTGGLGLWSGGTIVLVAQNGHGQGLSGSHVGDVQTLSNIDAHSFTQMSEWWLEQAFADGRVRLKVGRQDAGADFACVDYGGDFQNSSFGLIPTVPAPTFPDPALGASAFAELTDQISLGVGAYAPTPLSQGLLRGATLGLEVQLAPRRGAGSRYRVGLWHQRDPVGVGSHSSVYLGVDRPLYREGAGEQGLSAFVQLGASPGAPNGVSGYVGGGVVYEGLLPGRDEDRLGLGVAHARLAEWVGGGRPETDIELFYRWRPLRWLVLQPDLHFVVAPGGAARNAFIVGMRFEAEL